MKSAFLLIISKDSKLAELARDGMPEMIHIQQVETLKEGIEVSRKKGVTAVLAELTSATDAESLAEATGFAPLLALVKDEAQALELLDAGALQALFVPVDARRLGFAIGHALELAQLRRESTRIRETEAKPWVGSSPASRALLDRAEKLASHDATVLISGEAGSGKETLARFIHLKSPRSHQPFVHADASAEATLASCLIGAQGGTLYFHHVEQLEPWAQVMLHKAVKDSLLITGGREYRLDVRVMSSTREALRERVHKGAFREDLYWALAGVAVEVPPLRERSGDIEDLFRLFLNQASARLGKKMPSIPLKIASLLKVHPYPGNVLELRQLAGLMASLCEGGELAASALPADYLAPVQLGRTPVAGSLALKPAVHEFERQFLLRVLKAVAFNQSKVALALDIHRNTLILKMQELGIPNRRTKKPKK